MSTSEVNFATSLSNPLIRSLIKGHISDIRWDSVLAQKIAEFFTQPVISGSGVVPDAIIRSHFSEGNYIESEIENIISKCRDHDALGSNVDAFIKIFSKFYKRKMVATILSDSTRSLEDQAEEIVKRMSELPKIENNLIKIENLGDLDIDKVRLEEMGSESTLPSSFAVIQDVMPLRGYLRGSVVQICGSPGTGKSLFCMNEAVTLARAGYKGLYVALGDLMRMDMINRFSSLITGVSLSETQQKPNKYWTPEVQEILRNIKIVVVAAGTIDADALADLIESRVQTEGNIDFVVVDYDSNFQKTKESMYEEGDVVYNKMSSLARPSQSKYRLVFIASQPKQGYWKNEVIPMEAAAESARKQAIIDVMITLGKSIGARVKCGKLNIPKNRRGKADVIVPYMVSDCGHIIEIDEAQYVTLQNFSSDSYGDKKFNKKTNYGDYHS